MFRLLQSRRASILAGTFALTSTSCGRVVFDFPGDGTAIDGGLEAEAPVVPASCTGTETACGASCVDLRSAPRHCGRCGTRCTDSTPVCDRGSCSASCAAGLTDCGGACVDLSTDRAHCSSCGSTCGGSDVCIAGKCSCPVGKERCGPSCVSLASDPLHCGACGARCDGQTPVCNAGECKPACTGGLSACSGACIDLKADPEHCGDCSVVCVNGACTRGECVCAAGQVLCGKRCVDTTNDGNNCGVCGRGCPPSTVCDRGTCK